MVFPIIGARDYIDQRGFVLHRCPSCDISRVFVVYDTRRKLTLYFIPTLKVRSQLVMECMTCHGKWGISDERQPSVIAELMTQEQLSRHLENARYGFGSSTVSPTGRTLYQELQVDPEADPEVIEAAFKRLALKHHPDRSTEGNGSGAKMRTLIAAREVLSNPVRRRAYDASLGIVHRVEALRPEDV